MTRPKKPFQPATPRLCGGKRCYSNKREAERVAREQEMLNYNTDLKLKAYRCINCGEWHLTRPTTTT